MPHVTEPTLQVAKVAVRNLSGGVWLIADMSLNIFALSIVKALGPGYPAAQLVFLRAAVGLLVMAPFIWHGRHAFLPVNRPGLHLLRVLFSALTLTASFFAIARLPFAIFTSISFTRPVITMILAMILLHEKVPARRWIAAGVAFFGVYIAVNPGALSFSWGLPAALLMVLFGTLAIILTRQLSATPVVVLMTFYTAGLTLLTAPFVANSWVHVAPQHWLPLLAIGLFAQAAQFCFLRAHGRAEAAFLSVLGYLSLVFSTTVGFIFFKEVPTATFFIGSALIVAAALWTSLSS